MRGAKKWVAEKNSEDTVAADTHFPVNPPSALPPTFTTSAVGALSREFVASHVRDVNNPAHGEEERDDSHPFSLDPAVKMD